MTIPIVPGPWSWLATAGRGAGEIIQSRTNRKDKDREIAGKQLQESFDAVQSGALQSSVFKSPYVVELAKKSGVGDFLTGNIRARPEEALDAARVEEIPGALQNLSPGARQDYALTGKAPTRVEAKVADLASSQLEGVRPGTPQGRAVTKMPSEATAAAAELQAEDPALTNLADRHVQDLFAKTGKLPTPQQAMQAGFADPNTTALGTKLTESHYGAAIERQRRQLADEFTKRLIAQARVDSHDDPTKFLTRLTAQMDGLRKQRADLAKNLEASNLAALAIRASREGKKPKELQAEIQSQLDLLDAQIGSMQQQFNNAAGMQQPGATATPSFLTPEQLSAIVDRIKKQPNLAAQIDKDVAAGFLSPDDAKKIRDALKGGESFTGKGAGGKF